MRGALRIKTEREFQQFLTAYKVREKRPAGRQQKSVPRMVASEDQEQIALLDWARLFRRRYPALRKLAHIPNGGSRHVIEAVKLKRMGVLPGMPDLLLLYPARGFHAWAGELKAKDGKLTKDQRDMIMELRSDGYHAGVYYGWEQARDSLIWYLKASL